MTNIEMAKEAGMPIGDGYGHYYLATEERVKHLIALVRADERERLLQGVGLTDEQCDAIYYALDIWAKEIDYYEYGLPMTAEDGREVIRSAIRSVLGVQD
jgi:hypothetical protein